MKEQSTLQKNRAFTGAFADELLLLDFRMKRAPQIEIGSNAWECLHLSASLMKTSLGDSHRLSDQLTGIPPFVVVPAHHLDQIAIDDLGHAEIND